MRTWSRGDRIAFWSLVVGAISCYAAIKTIPDSSAEPAAPPPVQVPGTSAGTDPAVQQMLSQQEQLRQEQARAARDEAIRIFEERMALRRERMEARKADLRASGGGYSTVGLRNECAYPIDVAVNYMELDDTWITRGWWSVPPGQEVTTDIATLNRYIYLFAENSRQEIVWSLADGRTGITRPVREKAFTFPDGEPPVHPDVRSVGFFTADVGEYVQHYVHAFSCTSAAPPRTDSAGIFKLMG